MNDPHNRRAFLRAAAAAGAAWAAADLAGVNEALVWAHEQAAAPVTATTTSLTKPQADALDAVTARILPSVDGRPGAREAGALYFIDRALGTFNRAQKKLYADGLDNLNQRARRLPGAADFARLASAQQDEILRTIEKSPFFEAVRFDTIVGTFGLPSLGGNRDYAGWHLLGVDHQPRFQAPFGYYDGETARRG